MSPSKALRNLIASGETIIAPGVYDGISARLVEQAGFPAVYASGGAISRSAGMPDLGLLGMSEIVDRLENIVDATALPVIADADTGYGNALNVQRMVRAFERVGVAGFHLEDQRFPSAAATMTTRA
jgi:2-methylisocitrate lyase-like PEP mutase family enzyme